ncbi:methyltransferase-like protein 7A [Silurus meridionalis]|uniref:methyltransferase-like protein 7A n=1 Tax=Silurus meridionalis TaxID=175797 RepID=UPI001EEC67B7|nr:methyltransferase-like protein 7A [Silurus meridionalis]KAI5109578.1 methyltransferase like 7A precursor [Silurus meridionalis]
MALLMRACTLVVQLLTVPLVIADALGLYAVYKRFFPVIMNKFSRPYNEKMKQQKRELFRDLARFAPTRGPLRLLEIGTGTGTNFEYFPAGCRITCTDPNPHFQKYLLKNMELSKHLEYERFLVAPAEDLRQVEDTSVDAVVCTLVLCSVKNPGQVLQEAKRILREGGAFFFLEHVVGEESSWGYFFQHVLQPFWYYFGDGCELTRSTWQDVEHAGFSEVQLRHIHAPISFLIKPHIIGYAVK